VPGTESEFGGQPTHADEFRQFLNFPASHAAHGPPSGPVNPGAQKQIDSPMKDTLLAGQPWHAVTDVAVVMLWYVFKGHPKHCEVPMMLL
jgi:hypothetical protein